MSLFDMIFIDKIINIFTHVFSNNNVNWSQMGKGFRQTEGAQSPYRSSLYTF